MYADIFKRLNIKNGILSIENITGGGSAVGSGSLEAHWKHVLGIKI